jgi:glutaredoxin 3
MKKIEIYTKDYCPFCHRAKGLLQANQVEFIEYDLSVEPVREPEMRQRSGRSTVPEIFVDNRLIGGCDDLFALAAEGKLAETFGL